MTMQEAAEQARQGNFAYFEQLQVEDRRRLLAITDDDGRTLLHNAVSGGNMELVQFLLSSGAVNDVNQADEAGWTPLHTASSSGNTPAVAKLLEHGANVNVVTSNGLTPLHYAASKGHTDVAALLLDAGANPRACDARKTTPLHRASGTGHYPVVKLLIEKAQVPVDPRDASGATPLLLAVQRGAQATVIYLVSKGADMEAEDEEKQTPLAVAGQEDIKLQGVMVQVAKGEVDVDELLGS